MKWRVDDCCVWVSFEVSSWYNGYRGWETEDTSYDLRYHTDAGCIPVELSRLAKLQTLNATRNNLKGKCSDVSFGKKHEEGRSKGKIRLYVCSRSFTTL